MREQAGSSTHVVRVCQSIKAESNGVLRKRCMYVRYERLLAENTSMHPMQAGEENQGHRPQRAYLELDLLQGVAAGLGEDALAQSDAPFLAAWYCTLHLPDEPSAVSPQSGATKGYTLAKNTSLALNAENSNDCSKTCS